MTTAVFMGIELTHPRDLTRDTGMFKVPLQKDIRQADIAIVAVSLENSIPPGGLHRSGA